MGSTSTRAKPHLGIEREMFPRIHSNTLLGIYTNEY
jgi:hypothetical protein